jgi:subtilase family serine protease
LLDQSITGLGKRIVIIDAFQSPSLEADLQTFNAVFGLPAAPLTIIAPDGLTPFDPKDDNQLSWSAEITLDVEWAHAIAPGASITLVLAKSNEDTDILSATKYAVDHRLGDVISQSFGENETCVDPDFARKQHQIFVEATLKNITLFASSGDLGAALPSCDGSVLTKAVSSPAVDPLVVAVGGTALTAAPYCDTCGTPGTYVRETVWNDDFGASGGGFSVVYKKPLFQFLAVKGGKRGIPDVAYDGATSTGVLGVWRLGDPNAQPSLFIFGGTSAGTPQWAALLALADQRAGYNLGFINHGLYLIGLDRSVRTASFHDITKGNNDFQDIKGYNAAPGWDPTTGLGSPNAAAFVDNLIKFTSPFDGIIGIIETGPVSHPFTLHSGQHVQRPH